jgi:hypothetical protein
MFRNPYNHLYRRQLILSIVCLGFTAQIYATVKPKSIELVQEMLTIFLRVFFLFYLRIRAKCPSMQLLNAGAHAARWWDIFL